MARSKGSTLSAPILERSDKQITDAVGSKSLAAAEQLVWLKAYARENSLGLKGLAARTGIPIGTLSPLFNGKYAGDYDAGAARIAKFRNDLEKKRIFGGCRDFVETDIAMSLWKIFEKTRYNRRIQIIQSEEQLGKSRAAREYAHRNNGGRTIMVTMQPGGTSNGFGVFLRDLAQQLDVDANNKKIINVRFAIRSKLETCDLLIIDEFHQIEGWSDRAVRALLDYLRIELHADGERGLVLIATNSDLMTLIDTFRKRTKYNVGQLLGRMCNEVLELAPEEIPKSDITKLVKRYYSPSTDTLKTLYNATTQSRLGHFGLLDDILSRAWAEAQVNNRKMTDRLVQAVTRETMEDLQSRKKLYE